MPLENYFTGEDGKPSVKTIKCELGGNSVSFHSHKVTEDHRSLDNLDKIMEANRPQTKKQQKCRFWALLHFI